LAEILAMEVGIHGGSAKEQRDAIHFIRREVEKTGRCPSLFEAGEAENIDLDEKETLFTDGYHQGAVKIAGLRLR
jgi:hypothetical protein